MEHMVAAETCALRKRAVLSGHAGPVTALGFSWDGRKLLSGGEDAVLKWWDVGATPSKMPRASLLTAGAVASVACLRECEEALVTTAREKKLQHWDLAEGKLAKTF